jgi:hypothetical protein
LVGLNSRPTFVIRRVLIVGLLPRQFEAVRRRIGDRADLVHVNTQSGVARAIRQLETGAYAVVDTKFISHKLFAHIDRDRTRLCHGGDTTVTRAVETLLA